MPKHKKVVVKDSDIGKALFAVRHIKADKNIGRITGVVEEADYGSDYCMECGEGKVLEADPPFRFLNHSCDPNCELVIWEGDTPDDWKLCLHSIRAIEPGDELTIDYAWTADAAIPCLCRSEKCRGWIAAETELPLIQAKALTTEALQQVV